MNKEKRFSVVKHKYRDEWFIFDLEANDFNLVLYDNHQLALERCEYLNKLWQRNDTE